MFRVIPPFVTGVLLLGVTSCLRLVAPTGELQVLVDPTLSAAGRLKVGANDDFPHVGDRSTVKATRERDGSLLLDVSVRQDDCTAVSRVWLRDTPAGLKACASAYSSDEDGREPSWPVEMMRGSVRVNNDKLADLASKPLAIQSTLTGMCFGSEVTWECGVVLTQADVPLADTLHSP